MFYHDMNQIRCRLNCLGVILNEGTDYARRPLPATLADFKREHDELISIYGKPDRLKDGVFVAVAGRGAVKSLPTLNFATAAYIRAEKSLFKG